MKTYATLFTDYFDLNHFISEYIQDTSHPYLVRLYISSMDKNEAVFLARHILSVLPNAQIFGTSTVGVIFHGEQYDEGNLIMLDSYQDSDFQVGFIKWSQDDAKKNVSKLIKQLHDDKDGLMHISCANHYNDIHDFVEEMNIQCPSIRLSGGIAGDILSKDIVGYVFNETGVIENGIIYAYIHKKSLYVFHSVNTSHEPISQKFTLTSSHHEQWLEVDHQPIDKWIKDQLGIETLKDYSDWKILVDNDALVRFPMILDQHMASSRFLKYDGNLRGITQYYSRLPMGTQFRIGYVSPQQCLKESFRICNEMMEHPIESLFCYSCIFRRLYLHNCASWELSPYKELGICGAFMLGEISYNKGRNEFLNGSCCFVGQAENKVYIRPNIAVFDTLNQIEDDTKDLLNIVLKRQSENVSRYNDELLDRLLKQQIKEKDLLYKDTITGLYNYIKFKEDKETMDYDKLCMFKYENANIVISNTSHEHYFKLIQVAIDKITSFIEKMSVSSIIKIYIFNDNTFLISGTKQLSQTYFISLMRKIFDLFHFMTFEDYEEVLISRFVLVIKQPQLIESALNTFTASMNSQIPFIICSQENIDHFSTEDEFKMISIINWALENDGIVPYFQGIRNNKTKKISHYEALMRMMDVHGQVYLPHQFLSIAKKYNLYTSLSNRMIKKVLHLFANKKQRVGLNFSYYDIQEEKMQDLIFQHLKQVKNVSNIIIEIVEEEQFRDFELVQKFTQEVRKQGARIAIDDFGSGYSNLYELANIEPDYIKIDGSIITNVDSDVLKQKILNIIVHLAKTLNVEIVAEFVETEAVQKVLEQYDIDYSQGYLFSIPQPFHEIEEYIT